jgi:hypothetical protein
MGPARGQVPVRQGLVAGVQLAAVGSVQRGSRIGAESLESHEQQQETFTTTTIGWRTASQVRHCWILTLFRCRC